MSGAIDSLRKCLALNKKHVEARNLIGLVYFEVGRIGEAYREWLISVVLLSDQNPASDYLQSMEKNPRQLEKLNDTIRMYNQALEYIRQKSDDMAIIQLKKAIDINPSFVDALNLLALCYLMQGENDRALTVIEKALSADTNNSIALKYYKQATSGKSRPELVRPAKKNAAAPVMMRKPAVETGFGRSFTFAGIFGVIIGGLCAFLFLYMLIMPGRFAEMENEIEVILAERAAESEDFQRQLYSAQAEVTSLQQSESSIRERYQALETQIDINERLNRIRDAEAHLHREEFQEAVNVAEAINREGLPDDLVERIQNLRATAYPRLVVIYYNDAIRLYGEREYSRSRLEFGNAYRYMWNDDPLADDILYHLGRLAVYEGDYGAARTYFERVINEYPYGNRASDAQMRLGLLE